MMYSLPKSVFIDDVEYPITNGGDFRMILDCFNALNDTELDDKSRVLTTLIIFYNDINSIDDLLELSDQLEGLVKGMFTFFNCGQEESPSQSKKILIDWDKDSQLICSAVNNVAHMEIRHVDYIHWWTFMGYFNSVGESALSTVVGIRNKILSGKKLEKYEQKFRHDNPHYFIWNHKSADEVDIENQILEIWNSK